MRYVLRADASQSIGSGHVMRTSAFAEELIAQGEHVVFVGEISGLPWVEQRIASLGFTEIYNNSQKFISNPDSDVLLLDSYEIDIAEPFIAVKNWRHVVAIVDEQTPHYHCSLRIHPGLDPFWVGDSTTPILAGPMYIPIRASISKNRKAGARPHDILRIAVTAGGSDSYNLVFEIAKILLELPDLFEVYLFSNSTSKEILDSRFHFIEIGPKLDELIRNVDLVYTTASTSSLEFIALGLPIGVACAVENQEQYYTMLGRLGVASKIGIRNPLSEWDLDSEAIQRLATSLEFRESFIAKGVGLIDFKGASRIVAAIKTL